MKKFKIDEVTFTSSVIERFVRDGVKFIEITKQGHVYFWYDDVFIDVLPFPTPPCIDGVFSYPVGYINKLPQL